MKVNKITIIACLIAALTSGVAIIFLSNFSTLQNIVMGIFTSSIVSCIIALVNYFHEKNCIIEKTDNNLRSLYINISVLSKIIEKVLTQIHDTDILSNLMFNNIAGLSAFNVDFLNNMNLGLFDPFINSGKLNKAFLCLSEFQQTSYNIKSISANLQIQVLDYDNKFMRFQNNLAKGGPLDRIEAKAIDELKNVINIKTAKLHEYTTGKTLELEKIAIDFYNRKNNKQKWQEIKSSLLIQIEDIIRK